MRHLFRPVASLLRLLALALPIGVAASTPLLQGCGGGSTNGGCCKVCDTGKACGDSCIASNQSCTAPVGCACNK